MKIRFHIALLSIFFLFILLASCKKQEDGSQTPVIRPVRTVIVGGTGKSRDRSFSGVAKASVETRLSFRVGGEIERLPVKIGMKLKKGGLIAALDPADYELSVKQAQANLAQAQAQYSRAEAEYDRDRQLYEAGNISRSQLDRSLAAYKSGKAQTEAAQKSVELVRHQLKYTILVAPIDGSIGSLPVEIHQTVAPGQVIATLTSGGALEVETGIPESLISQIHVDDAASIHFDAIPDRKFAARVIEVGVEATETMTYPVKVQVLEDDERLRSGMVGQVEFKFESEHDYITIPLVAVAATPKGEKYVWVYQPDKNDRMQGKMKRRNVEIGSLTSRGLQIEKGLEPGEIIAVRGVHKITENMQVRTLPATEATKEMENNELPAQDWTGEEK